MSRSALRINEVAPSARANTATMSSPSAPSTWYTLAPAARRASARNVSALRGMVRVCVRTSCSRRLRHLVAASLDCHPASMTKCGTSAGVVFAHASRNPATRRCITASMVHASLFGAAPRSTGRK